MVFLKSFYKVRMKLLNFLLNHARKRPGFVLNQIRDIIDKEP